MCAYSQIKRRRADADTRVLNPSSNQIGFFVHRQSESIEPVQHDRFPLAWVSVSMINSFRGKYADQPTIWPIESTEDW